MGRIRNSIELAKASWRVLRADKEILLLPLISGIAAIVVMASFAVPLVVTRGTERQLSGVFFVLLFVMYVVLSYITIFFNAALVSAAHERLTGGDPTLGSALAGARARAGKILPWALVSATVSIILRAIEQRAGALGRIISGIAGMAWAVVTFLVLPIIVIEGIGVGDAVRKSGQMFRDTWGENLVAQVGFGIIGFVAALPGIALIVAGVLFGGSAIGVGIVLGGLWLIGVAVVLSAMSLIFQTALYHFALDGKAPEGYFSGSTLTAAFAPKQGRIAGFGGGFAG